MKKTMLDEMSWIEFSEAMAKDDVVIFPVGSIEEHGPHNPLGTDTFIAKACAKVIGERSNAVVAPVLPIGNARNLMGFPGTATVDPELLRDVIYQICENLIHHGAKKILFINGHGGNTATLKIVSADLMKNYNVFSTQTEWWLLLPQISEYKCNDHGGHFETSMVMAIDETLVDMSKAKTKPQKNFTKELVFDGGLRYRGSKVAMGYSLDHVSELGNYGAEAEKANKELGDKLFETYVEYCVDLVAELRKIRVKI